MNPTDPEILHEVDPVLYQCMKNLSAIGLSVLRKQEEDFNAFEAYLNSIVSDNRKGDVHVQEAALRFEAVLNTNRQTGAETNQDAQTDVSDKRIPRRAAQIANLKNKSFLALTLNQKLRQPSYFAPETSSAKLKQNVKAFSKPPNKYQRTHMRQSAGSAHDNEIEIVAKTYSSEENKVADFNQKIINEEKDENTVITTSKNIIAESMIPDDIDKNIGSYKQLLAAAVVQTDSRKTKGTTSGMSDSGISEINVVNEHHKVNEVVVDEIEEEVPRSRFRTKVVKQKGTNGNVEEYTSESKAENTTCKRTRTKILKKSVTSANEEKAEKVEETNLRTRTKVIKNPIIVINDDVLADDICKEQNTEKETSTLRTRTKVKKAIEYDIFDENESSDETRYVAEKNNTKSRNIKKKENLVKEVMNVQENSSDKNVKKPTTRTAYELPQSEMVKKRIEEFEKGNVFTDKSVLVEKSGGRVTRTKTRAMVAALAVVEQPSLCVMGEQGVLQECEKENLYSSPGKHDQQRLHGPPLANHNRSDTPFIDSTKKQFSMNKASSSAQLAKVGIDKPFIRKISSPLSKKTKTEELIKKQKKVEATKKKENALKATADKAHRKREERLQRAAATREAAEKEKVALIKKLEKEKEEKLRQGHLEMKKIKEKELAKKKLITQQKLNEAEERRKQEEAVRLAKIKEQEEEYKILQSNREKDQEAAERLHQKHHMEKLRVKEAEKLKKNPQLKLHKVATTNAATNATTNAATDAKFKLPIKPGTSEIKDTYVLTPHRDERQLLSPKCDNDYGIDDVGTDDSSDDEEKPKKKIPKWAERENRNNNILIEKYCTGIANWDMFMSCDARPDINELFTSAQQPRKKRLRTSSAVWSTPPLLKL